MINDIEKAIREYLPNVIHMSLATSHNNIPWICEVHFVFDNDLNLYFQSKASRRHSREIEQNENVAGNIVKQHSLGEKPRGVYFEGKARRLDGVAETQIAQALFGERFGSRPKKSEKAKSEDSHAFYKISVKTYYLFDGIESDPGQKYELNWKSTTN